MNAVKNPKQYIVASSETVAQICATVKGEHKKNFVTKRTVHHALSFQSNSTTAQLIRQIALSRGAELWELQNLKS